MNLKILVAGLGQMGTFYLGKLTQLGVPQANIVGVDIDPAKIEKAWGTYPDVVYAGSVTEGLTLNPNAAIVATNTPSHHVVIRELMDAGVRWVLTEKPLGLTMANVDSMKNPMLEKKVSVFTAFLMNFSPAILNVMEKMEAEGLILTEGSVVWGKNRFGDSRPTPGDLEDETVHGAGILHALAKVNQAIREIYVAGQLTFPKFASEEAQAKAHAIDPSFPLRVNASSMVLESIRTNRCEIFTSLHSSFILGSQVRRVTAILSKADDPFLPVYSVEFNFDVKENGAIVDHLTVTTLSGNVVAKLSFPVDKLCDQTRAFLTAANGGEVDLRLTDYTEARAAVALSDAIRESHSLSGAPVQAFSEADILELKVA